MKFHHKQTVVISESGYVCIFVKGKPHSFEATIHSIAPYHCGGAIRPRIENVTHYHHQICFQVVIEPGDICEITLLYNC